jgi:hypothetical protein
MSVIVFSRVVVPAAVAVPKLCRARIENHAVERHAEKGAPALRGAISSHRLQRHAKFIILRANVMGVAAIRKTPVSVVGNAVADDVAIIAAHGDFHFVFRQFALLGESNAGGQGQGGKGKQFHNALQFRV